MPSKKNPKNKNPNEPEQPNQPTKSAETPEKPVFKVGDIIAIKPMVGVVYENGNKGMKSDIRIQLADGTKIKNIPPQYWSPAPKPLAMAYLKTAPEELKPEAVIAREAEELHLTVEDFMAGVAGGHFDVPEKVEVEKQEDDEE